MIDRDLFLSKVKEIQAERPAYALGHDGRDGLCDCIGLIIGAVRRAGGKWTGTHGSNWAARNAMASLRRIGGIQDLMPGMAVYKAFMPDDVAYSLPDAYARHLDKRDYYHVGVVMSVQPLRIWHCTSLKGGSGIKEDTELGRWAYGGELKAISKNGGTPMDTAVKEYTQGRVEAPSGLTVNLRREPITKSSIVYQVPVNQMVGILEEKNGWTHAQFGELTGWMQSKFIRKYPPTLTRPRDQALSLLQALKKGLDV